MQILYQDDYLIAVNKPAGLLVHRSRIAAQENRFAMQLLRDMIGQRVYPVHRLDKPASGVLLFALQKQTATEMVNLFASGNVEKTYLAVVRGYTEESGMIDYPLKEQHDKMMDALANHDKPAQSAVTEYRRLAIVELPFAVGRYSRSRYSLISVNPLTGRKHQIRRHMKHIFHPIIGDTTHGDGKHNIMFREKLSCQQLLLHALRISFLHPCLNIPLCIEAPLDDTTKSLFNRIGWREALITTELSTDDHIHRPLLTN
jgi:tRNA pseudouridine65 synthase